MHHLRSVLPGWMLPAHVVTLPTLPLNASGKVDRKALPPPPRPAISGREPRDGREAALATAFADVLGARRVSIDDDFFALGGDSIRAIQVAARLGAAGLGIGSGDILQHRTVAALAPLLRGPASRGPRGPASGPFPLTPVQTWFFDRAITHPEHFNQAVLLRAADRLDPATVAAAIDALAAHHDMLRARFVGHGGAVLAHVSAAQPPSRVELIEVEPEGLQRACSGVQARLDLATGPLFRAAVLRLPDADRLLWAVHHLAVDAVSWRILLDDLETTYEAAMRGSAALLPPRSDSFIDWAKAIRQSVAARDLGVERRWWGGADLHATARLPLKDGPDVSGDAATLSALVGAEVTTGLLAAAGNGEVGDTQDRLLAALAIALRPLAGPGRFPVLVETHGREATLADIDVSRTVGWFTSFHPVVLELSEATVSGQVASAREAVRSVPARGTGYLLFDGWAPARAQVSFNYLGRFEGDAGARRFALASEPGGLSMAASAARPVPVEFLASVADGNLRLALTFNARLAVTAVMQRLLDGFVQALPALCGSDEPAARGAAGLAEAEIDVMLQDWA